MVEKRLANIKEKLKSFIKIFKPNNKLKKIIYSFVIMLIIFHVWLYFSDPYSAKTFYKNPYTTSTQDGQISYKENYSGHIHINMFANLLGYYKSGFLIVNNTLFGAKPIKSENYKQIISEIHKERFDPAKPYLISGDQFSVLYPRNLGVFYNQLLDPNTALDQNDWQNRQRIYLQSVLYAIDGLSSASDPRTTIVPISPKSSIVTEVHPGSSASDSIYGVLYAIDTMDSLKSSNDGKYSIQTQDATNRLLSDKGNQLRHMVESYVHVVQDPNTKLVRQNLELSSARDGVIRNSSFYDNVILWKTLQLANKYGLYQTNDTELDQLKQKIKFTFWNEANGFYKNDINDYSFSSDWLIGYPTGFFDLNDKTDLARTAKTIKYIRDNGLTDPLPIKYQIPGKVKAPFFVSKFAPEYGGNTIWSYWGSEYMTLLANLYSHTYDKSYLEEAEKDLVLYRDKIVQYGGFPETFDANGNMLQAGLYKSILITGWVVQYEHAAYLINNVGSNQSN